MKIYKWNSGTYSGKCKICDNMFMGDKSQLICETCCENVEYNRGLMIGKFYPVHIGHVWLIEESAKLCRELIVEIQCDEHERQYSHSERLDWLDKSVSHIKNVKVVMREYDSKLDNLSNTSKSDEEISKKWSKELIKYSKSGTLPCDIIFGSEEYVPYLANFMEIDSYKIYSRKMIDISSSQIRINPYKYWEYLTKPFKETLIRIIIIVGTESTYKSTLVETLGKKYDVPYVLETARENNCNSLDYNISNLENNIKTQDDAICNARELAISKDKKFIIVDTSELTTYGYYLFKYGDVGLMANPIITYDYDYYTSDIYLYCVNDCKYIQDGARLSEEDRNKLDEIHRSLYEPFRPFYLHGELESKLKAAEFFIESQITL